MEIEKYLPTTIGVLKESKEVAQKLNLKNVDIDVFTAVFLDNLSLGCISIIQDIPLIERMIDVAFKKINSKTQYEYRENISLTPKLKKFLESCESIAFDTLNLDYLAPEVIFVNLLSPEFAPKFMRDIFLEDGHYNELADTIIFRTTAYLTDDQSESFEVNFGDHFSDYKTEETGRNEKLFLDMFSDNEILSQFAENLNIKAANGEFDKVVDFDNKVEELATILCRNKKPNAILVGKAGCGKTALIGQLASNIVNGKAPELLSDKVIYSLSLSSMVAGTQFRGQFEERLENFVNEVKKYHNIIIFIDEIHTLVGAGGTQENSLEASNILKPELARGTISCIGATTINEYTNTIKKDSALDRRFERVTVREPSKFQMKEILPSIVEHYEKFHCVKYSEEFLENVLIYCERFMTNKCYPDKAVDVIDHCGAQAKLKFWSMDEDLKNLRERIINDDSEEADSLLQEFEGKVSTWVLNKDKELALVTIKELKDFFDQKENPLNKKDVLNNFFKSLQENFVGNRKQIQSIKENIILANLGLSGSDAQQSVFCINGAKNSGKTMFIKLLKESLEIEGANVLSYNGVHFSDDYASFKIVPERHNNTSLCEKVLMYPNSIIIIDDFHKIHSSTYTLFSEIFKEGRVQMNSGDIADFSNCKFFLTSDVISEKTMGFSNNKENLKSVVPEHLSKYFSSNIFLKELDDRNLRRVLYNKLKFIQDSLRSNGISMTFNFNFILTTIKNLPKNSNKILSLNEQLDKIKNYIAKQVFDNDCKILLENVLTDDSKNSNIQYEATKQATKVGA